MSQSLKKNVKTKSHTIFLYNLLSSQQKVSPQYRIRSARFFNFQPRFTSASILVERLTFYQCSSLLLRTEPSAVL